MDILKSADPEIWNAIAQEARRQQDGLEMIASENYTSAAVMAAQGSCLTNKYAEGYPGRRYYGGCEFVDVAEKLAIDRVKALFGAAHANVQPHSGAQANMAVFLACLQPGDTILTMDLAHGGHLTHGMRLNFSGKFYKVVHYGVTKDAERIDYAQMAALAREHKPKLVLAGFRIVSGGTDNHMILVDVASRGVTGKAAEQALDAAGITVNKNMIPFDTRPPLDPSGVRIGTPALTTRGMKEAELRQVAG